MNMETITISQKRYEELLHTESVHQLLKTFLAKKAKDYSPMSYNEVQMLSELLNVGDSE
jgi:predicted CopG family antitoxin